MIIGIEVGGIPHSDHRNSHGVFALDGRPYAAAVRSSPGTWNGENGADVILVESTDNGETFEAVSYLGEPEEVVLAWIAVDWCVLAGTNAGRRISRESNGTWTVEVRMPAGIRSLTVY